MKILLAGSWSTAFFFWFTCASAEAATHAVGNVSVTPSAVVVNVAAPLTITVQINDPSVIPTSVNLLLYDASGNATVLSRLYDDGTHGDATAGDGIYTVVADFSLPAGSQLAASAAFVGALKRVISAPTPMAFVTVPTAFAANTAIVGAGGPLSLDNFNGAYNEGGIIPSGGAAIDITAVPLPPSVSDYIQNETTGSSVASISSVTVSGIVCTEVSYSDSFPPALTIDSVATYCPSGSQLFKFYLSYNSGDPNTNQFLSSYQQVLSNAQLTP
jgi:hypothetical protein